jgi:hypothetical protein
LKSWWNIPGQKNPWKNKGEILELSKDGIKQAISEVLTARTLQKVCAVQAIIILAIGVAFYTAHKRQAARMAEAQAFSSAQQQIIDRAKNDIAKRQVEMEAARRQWNAERQQIKSAAAAIKIITKYVPGTTGQTVVIPAAQISPEIFSGQPGAEKPQGAPGQQAAQIAPEAQVANEQAQAAPAAPETENYVLQTEQAAIKTAIAVQEGQQCKSELGGCLADIKDFRAQVQALELDRKKWRETAKGGSTAKRLLRGFAIGACGAGGAAIGAEKGSKGAAIGSLIGAAGCAILTR